MLREWDAHRYHELSDPQFAWGQRVLERVELHGDERVLDAGCGTGRLTTVLRSRVPRGRVTALDLSERMVSAARGTLRVESVSPQEAPAWHFATPGVTRERLERAGFIDVRCWLEETPVTFQDAGSHRAFLETVVMRHFLAALPTAALRDRLLDLMTEGALRDDPPLTLDYWRLNIDAARP
jgi:SAM-dependent methyltransferase